jgi:predicted N-formylglutamate amidohydrolase
MSRAKVHWLVTCEHGGNHVPADYQSLFASKRAVAMLRSHRGYDPGAWEASLQIIDVLHNWSGRTRRDDNGHENLPSESVESRPLDATGFRVGFGGTWIASRTTRLLVDLNRSPDASDVFSEFSLELADGPRISLLHRLHAPYRESVLKQLVHRTQADGRVIHLSIHTFTPRINGRWRPIDVGLLFDPERDGEASLCDRWRKAIGRSMPRLRVMANQPYAGTDDGLTKWLRAQFNSKAYVGIEVEISNRYFKRGPDVQAAIVTAILQGLTSQPEFVDRTR